MGLDMYLTRKTYVKNWEHMKPSERHVITIAHEDGSPVTGIDLAKVSYIEEEVGYWRKANQIHAWFVANVQDGKDDCGTYYVGQEQLQELLDTCEKATKDTSLAKELLPTQEGFFFGSTDYDEYYFDDLKQTIEILKPLVTTTGGDYHYHSSW